MRDDINSLRLALSDQESGLEGHMRSGNEEYLERYREGIERELSALERLESDAVLVVGAAADLDQIRAAARKAARTRSRRAAR